MSGSAQQQHDASPATKLGFAPGQIVQEFGYDDDVDNDLRFEIEDVVGNDLEDEDYRDVADVALVWFREGDGDLVDLLVDTLTQLADDGFVVLATPKAGRGGHVDAADIADSANTSGLNITASGKGSADWSLVRLAAPHGARR